MKYLFFILSVMFFCLVIKMIMSKLLLIQLLTFLSKTQKVMICSMQIV
ncbi:MAG: hypothetical protein PWQ06_2106 [Anaerophaga sp.]|jgi:hypothetical protein|nr:hypothetical protein [Anaerophaga sp.]